MATYNIEHWILDTENSPVEDYLYAFVSINNRITGIESTYWRHKLSQLDEFYKEIEILVQQGKEILEVFNTKFFSLEEGEKFAFDDQIHLLKQRISTYLE